MGAPDVRGSLFDEKLFERLVMYIPENLQAKSRVQLAKAADLFCNDRHFDVISCLNDIIALCIETGRKIPAHRVDPGNSMDEMGPPTPTALSMELFVSFIRESRMYKMSSSKVERCEKLLHDLEDTMNWQPLGSIDSAGRGIFYRSERAVHIFKVIGDIDSNLQYVVSVLFELNLYSEWFPFCSHAVMQGEVTRFHRSSHLVIRMPWPLADRDTFLEGYGIDDLTNAKRVIVVSRSLSNDEALPPEITAPKPQEKYVRMDMKYSGFIVEALSPKATRLSFVMNVDPKVPHIPSWALNWVSGQLVWAILVELGKTAKIAESPTSKYAKRRQERPDVYVYFQERMREIEALHFSKS